MSKKTLFHKLTIKSLLQVNKVVLYALVICNAFTNVGCSGKSGDLPKHENPKSTQTLGLENLEVSNANVESLLKTNVPNLQLEKLKISLQSNSITSNDESFLRSQIEVLKKAVLDPKNIYATTNNARDLFRQSLYYLNLSILKLIKQQKLQLKDIKDYLAVVLESCQSDLTGCKNVRIFATDPGTHQLLIWSAKQSMLDSNQLNLCPVKGEKIDQYYCYLYLSYETKSQSYNEDLAISYLKHGKEYLSALRNRSDLKNLERHQRVFENIFLTYQTSNVSNELKNMINDFTPWLNSNVKSNDFKASTIAMMELIGSDFFYADSGKTKLSDKLTNAIEVSQQNPDHLGSSFRTSFENSIKKGNAHIFENLGVSVSKIQNSSFYDEYFYLIDRWYRGHTNIEFTEKSFFNTNKDLSKLAQKVSDYAKVTLLVILFDTKEKMREILLNPEIYKNNIVQIMNDNLFSISDRWKYALKQFEVLAALLDGLAVKSEMKNIKELRAIEIALLGLRTDIRTLIAGPAMMMTSYFYAINNVKVRLVKDFSVVKLDGSSLIEDIIAPELERGGSLWFDFGNESDGLTKIEVLVSYLYTLQTNIYESFGGNDYDDKYVDAENSVSRMKLLELIYEQLFSKERRSYTDAKQDFAGYNRDAATYLRLCENLKTKSSDDQISIKMVDLLTTTGLSTSWNDSGRSIYGFYLKSSNSIDSNTKDDTTIIGSLLGKFQKKRNIFELMVSAFEAEAKVVLANKPSKLSAILKKAKFLKDSVLNEGKSIVSEVLKYHLSFRKCFSDLYQLEMTRENQLIRMEEDFLRQLYKDAKVSILKNDILGLKALEKKYKFTPGNDSLELGGYRLSRYDFLSRNIDRLEKYIKPKTVADPLSDSDLDTIKAIAPLWIPFVYQNQFVNEDKFVKMALSLLSSSIKGADRFINWPKYDSAKQVFYSKANISLALWGLRKMYPEYFDGIDNQDTKTHVAGITDDILIEDWIEFIQTQLLSPEDFNLLNKLQISQKVVTGRVDSLFIKDKDLQRYFFDEAFETLLKLFDPTDYATEVFKQAYITRNSNFKLSSDLFGSLINSVKSNLRNTKLLISDFEKLVVQAEQRYNTKFEYKVGNSLVTPVAFVDIDAGTFINYRMPKYSNNQYILFDRKISKVKNAELNDFIIYKTNGLFEDKGQSK